MAFADFCFGYDVLKRNKAPLDYTVFIASAGAFGLSLVKEKFLEIDNLMKKK